MKNGIAIASLLGIVISVLLAALEAAMPNKLLESLQLPGILTLIFLWGHGGSVPDFVSEAVMIGINAVVYGLITFGIFRRTRSP